MTSLDMGLYFLNARVTNPPPPLDKLMADFLDNIELVKVTISNPLTSSNILDTEEAWLAVHSLTRIRQALACPFNTPDRCFEREEWLKLVLKVLASIHGGLCNCQLASPEEQGKVPDAFTDLTTTEDAISACIYEVLDDLSGFFWSADNPNNDDNLLKTHCFRCVQTTAINIKNNNQLLKTIQMNTALDMCKLRETLLNKAVCETHK